jgi:hypothetical protein
MILQRALIAFALYRTSLPTDVSFMILLVTMITSSAVFASSFIIKYTICRSEASLFWNNFEMPKKREVASLVGNLSPVKRRSAIFVRSMRHLRGEIGEELNRRAGSQCQQAPLAFEVCLPSWKTEVLSTFTMA